MNHEDMFMCYFPMIFMYHYVVMYEVSSSVFYAVTYAFVGRYL